MDELGTRIGEDRKKEYITARGVVIVFKPLPPTAAPQIDAALEIDWPRPTVPTYEASGLGDDIEVLPYDESSAKGDPESEKIWADYMDEIARRDTELNTRLARFIQIRCMDFKMPEDESWIEEHEFSGLPVPEDRLSRRLHYIKTEVVGSQDDIVNILAIPMQLSMERSADLIAAERLFRLAAERGNPTERVEEDDEARDVATAERVVVGSESVGEVESSA